MAAQKNTKRTGGKIAIALLAIVVAGGGLFFFQGSYFAQSMMHHRGGHMHGADGTGHDEVNMPGLKGANATERESEELAIMFRNFETLSRTVENLPNGIRTVTSSSDENVMASLASHVIGMIDRVEAKDDPQIIIQSKTLDIFFLRGDKIKSEIDMTEEGIVVIQTSDDPEIVTALQVHAAEVSDMAERGMQAVHEKMMRN